jgi:serine/threonine protein kinase
VLGEGGMGIVYLAEQREPVRRRVALKVLKSADFGSNVLARFESESQALALMDHPNIARIYDAGTTSSGRPYFAMEYVPGIPTTDYCDRNLLGFQARLALFQQVCQAVHHAHQKGIIHRDIKPSNVLIMLQDGKPVPKVIDFGVAKALNQRLAEKTLFTEIGMLIGTPEYMSGSHGFGYRQHHRHLLAGSAALRTAGRRASFRFENASQGGIRRDSAHHSRDRAAEAFDAPEQPGRRSGPGSGAPAA